MKKPPFIRLYIKDFAFDIQDMLDEELGKYMRSLLSEYKNGKVLRKNEEFSLQKELKKSLASYNSVCKQNKKNRAKSKASKKVSSTNGQRVVNGSLTNNQEPITKNQEPLKNKEYKESFIEFWNEYPNTRKGSKDTANRSYLKALSIASEADIILGLRKYNQSKQVADGFAKGCAAWLNDEGWKYNLPKIGMKNGKQSSIERNAAALQELVDERRADEIRAGAFTID